MTGPLPLRCAPGPVTFGRKKARAFPLGKPGHFETRILCLLQQSSVTVWLQHSRRSAESQARFRLRRRYSKWADRPLTITRRPTHHAASARRTYNLRDQPVLAGVSTTTYAMLLLGSSQASGPAPVFTEGAQTINSGFFIPQDTGLVNIWFSTYCIMLCS